MNTYTITITLEIEAKNDGLAVEQALAIVKAAQPGEAQAFQISVTLAPEE